MQNWTDLEGYSDGAIYSRLLDVFTSVPETFVLCTIPRLYTPHCAKELESGDKYHRDFELAGLPLVFASTDSPEVAERYFGENPVKMPFIRINRNVEYDLGTIDRHGDAQRSTFFIKDGEVKDVEVYAFDSERDMFSVLQKAKKILV